MLSLTPAELAKVKAATDRAYHLFNPVLRTIFNEQLLESRNRYEFEDWLERVELTARFYEGNYPRMKVARPRKSASPGKQPSQQP